MASTGHPSTSMTVVASLANPGSRSRIRAASTAAGSLPRRGRTGIAMDARRQGVEAGAQPHDKLFGKQLGALGIQCDASRGSDDRAVRLAQSARQDVVLKRVQRIDTVAEKE